MRQSRRVVFTILGIACASCAIDVGRAVRRIPGVVDVNINYIVDRGYVEFDPDVTSWDQVAAALVGRGYMVVPVR